MWKRMMRIWLVGTAMTLGGLDGPADLAPDVAAVRVDAATRDGAVDDLRDSARDVISDADAAAAPPRPVRT